MARNASSAFLIFSIVASIVAAGFSADARADTQTWTIAGEKVTFHYDKATNLIVDQPCFAKGKACRALERLPSADLSKITEQDRQGGKNPGGVLCKKVLGGTVLIGVDAEMNRSSFCRFEDGSLLDNGSIYFEAMRKR